MSGDWVVRACRTVSSSVAEDDTTNSIPAGCSCASGGAAEVTGVGTCEKTSKIDASKLRVAISMGPNSRIEWLEP